MKKVTVKVNLYDMDFDTCNDVVIDTPEFIWGSIENGNAEGITEMTKEEFVAFIEKDGGEVPEDVLAKFGKEPVEFEQSNMVVFTIS